MLTVAEVQETFDISREQVYKMARALNLPKGSHGEWLIPDDFIPVYIPDGREYKSLKGSSILP